MAKAKLPFVVLPIYSGRMPRPAIVCHKDSPAVVEAAPVICSSAQSEALTVALSTKEDAQITIADRLPAGLPQFDPTQVPWLISRAIYVDTDGNGVFDAPGGRERALWPEDQDLSGELRGWHRLRCGHRWPREAEGISQGAHHCRFQVVAIGWRPVPILPPALLILSLAWPQEPLAAIDPPSDNATEETVVDPAPEEAAPKKKWPHFNIVLGSGLIFIGEESFRYADSIRISPTGSAIVAGELFLAPRWRMSLGYELPIGLQSRTVDGQVEQQIMSSVAEVGLVAVPIWFDFAEAARMEVQLQASGGMSIAASPVFFPRFGFRLNLMQDASKGVGLLFGVNYSFFLDRLAFFYGTEYRF